MPAQQEPEVFPLEPVDGAVVGPRPVFQLGYQGLDQDNLRSERFRIELKALWHGGPSFQFDQRNQRSGWTPGEPGRVIYRPLQPLPDGPYSWRVARWDGLTWLDSPDVARLRIDSIPPAAVGRLRVHYLRERSEVRLEWDPVVLDEQGGAEFVARYHVYRYPRADNTPNARPFEVARTDQTRIVLATHGPEEEKLWFYRVSAVDLAGNEAGRPD